jgi:hypothetical protein
MDGRFEQIAEAFSRHRFTEVYPFLADDVQWDIVGDRLVVGSADVRATCEQSAGYLATVRTDFRRFRTVVGDDSVVVDSDAQYTDQDGASSLVASCDLYDFAAGTLTRITSYTVQRDDPGD